MQYQNGRGTPRPPNHAGPRPVPSHVGRLETPGPLRTHGPSSQPHYTTGLWPALGAASPPRHHDHVRPRWTSPSPEEACHAAAALPCPATCACVPACLGPRWGRPPRASRPHWHILQESCKRKAGIALLSGCIVPTPAPSLASASLRYQQPLYTLLPLLWTAPEADLSCVPMLHLYHNAFRPIIP